MNLYHEKVYRNLWHFLAFGFGTGTFPKIPGTIGTLAALPFYFLMCHLKPAIYIGVWLTLFLFGIWLCDVVSQDLNYDDYPGIVWDEILGYLLALFLLPVNIFWILAAFVLFRIFDIWKPSVIGWVNRHVKGGLGVVLDDVLAGMAAWVILQVFRF